MADTTQPAHAHEPRHCEVSDLFSVSGTGGADAEKVLAASAEYLRQFAAPVENADGKPVCFHCGKPINAFMQAVGLAVAYRWSIAHGEANCSGCGWPARGMHYPKAADGTDLWSAQNLFLAYHPDVVETRQTTAQPVEV